MEQRSRFYDNDANETYFSSKDAQHDLGQKLDHTQQQGLTQIQLNEFIIKLLTTIDMTKLNELYFQHLSITLPLSGLKIQFEDSKVIFGKTFKNAHLKTFNCMQVAITVAVMDYSFNEPLSLNNWQILQQMHVNFCHAFRML